MEVITNDSLYSAIIELIQNADNYNQFSDIESLIISSLYTNRISENEFDKLYKLYLVCFNNYKRGNSELL